MISDYNYNVRDSYSNNIRDSYSNNSLLQILEVLMKNKWSYRRLKKYLQKQIQKRMHVIISAKATLQAKLQNAFQ